MSIEQADATPTPKALQARVSAMRVEQIPLTQIQITENRRLAGSIESLKDSIEQIGLLNPITVTADFRLISGHHRFQACQALGWEKIPASIFDHHGLLTDLAQIDENLQRSPLTILERAEHLYRRKEIFEQLYPDSKPEEQRKKGLNTSGETISRLNESETFVADTARVTGTSQRCIQQDVQIATKIAPDVKAKISGSPVADNKTALLKISKLSPEAQATAVSYLLSGGKPKTSRPKSICKPSDLTRLPNLAEGSFDSIVIDLANLYAANAGSTFPSAPHARSEAEIGSLKITECGSPDCTLWLWTSNARIGDAFQFTEAWGFEPVTVLTWVKGAEASGVLREHTEHCIVSVRGRLMMDISDQGIALIHPELADTRKKPEEFYKLVERLFPGSKVELFCESQREGWGTTPLSPPDVPS